MRLETPRLVVTLPDVGDIPRILAFYARNREHLAPWEPRQPDGFDTAAYWRDRIARFRAEARENVSLRLFVLPRGDDAEAPVIGLVSFTRFFALPVKMAQLGYAIDRACEGQGLVTEAVRASLAYLAETRGVRRVTATYQPENVRSARVLARLGFVVDGVLPKHLFTAGAWRDHVRVYCDLDRDPVAP